MDLEWARCNSWIHFLEYYVRQSTKIPRTYKCVRKKKRWADPYQFDPYASVSSKWYQLPVTTATFSKVVTQLVQFLSDNRASDKLIEQTEMNEEEMDEAEFS